MNKLLLKEGDIIKLSEEHTIYANIPKHFIFANKKGDFEIGHAQVWLKEPELDWLLGKYVVLRTLIGGGGMNSDGVYPHGHHVYCEKIEEPAQGIKIDFYQSGCFTAMIPEITPIGKAVRKWVTE